MRYRGVLMIGHYDNLRLRGFNPGFIISVPEKEVYFPDELCFPFAVAYDLSVKELRDRETPQAIEAPELPLVFATEAGEAQSRADLLLKPPARRRFQITVGRMIHYGGTPGCKSCSDYDSSRPHTPECRKRFLELR